MVAGHWSKRHIYRAEEWEAFCADHGIHWIYAELPDNLPALIADDTIVLHEDLRELGPLRDYYAWHELSHWILHVGDERFLRTLPCGWMILSKQERQASEFALTYPIWDPFTARRIAQERGIE
jgi:hypothetical protein